MIVTESMYGGLYYLNLDSKPVACSSSITNFDQHCRLGHPPLQVLLNYVASLNCDSCQLNKHHHMPYPDRVTRRAHSFSALVHSNVLSPYPITLKLSFKYFIIFV